MRLEGAGRELIPGRGREDVDQLDRAAAAFAWPLFAREAQLEPPGAWSIWLYQGGRGAGKTRAGAEWIRGLAAAYPGIRLHLIGSTSADIRDVMVDGESGVLACSPPWFRPTWEPSKRTLRWPNGSRALAFSAEEPNRLRGPQCHALWADEIAAWAYPETWHLARFGLRLPYPGRSPRALATTTPKPGHPLLRELYASPDCTVTRSSMLENAGNLDPTFVRAIEQTYQGTRYWRQEALGEYLEEAEGALWARAALERDRVREAPPLRRIVVAIDPAVTSDADSDETGIVAAGVDFQDPPHGYLLEDLSGRFTPDAWARRAVGALERLEGDRIIGEANNGGDLIEYTVRTIAPSAPFRKVHASRGKLARAEPIAALSEQGRVHHVGGFGELEDQLCSWEPRSGQRSPDRLDAYVWALTELMLDERAGWDFASRATHVEGAG